MDKLLKQEKNFNSICHSCVSENPAENKAVSTAGSSGSADAAPRMTKNKQCAAPRMTEECGHFIPTCHPELDGASKKQSSELFFVRKAIRHNESKWKTQDELMSELKSILPLKNKGSQRGFAQNPSCTFPYALREGQIGRSTPIFHPWTSVSKIPAFAGMTEQVGRSMVEMLGTLAIMGIIAITGIWGFNAAMNSHRANEVLYEVSKRAYGCMAQINMMGRACNLSEYGDKLEGYATSTLSFPNNYFGIKVAEVPEKICRQIHNKGLSVASQILPETCAATNDMIFIFDPELKGSTENLPRQCTPATKTIDCPYDGSVSCTSDGFCGCQSGSTMTKVGCCPNDKILNGACCRYGIKEENGEKLCCNSAVDQCCPPGELYHGGRCHSCTEEADFHAFESWSYRCDACPNRVQSQYDCLLACRESDQIVVNGSCHCPTLEKPIMALQGANKGLCVSCDQGDMTRLGYTYSGVLGYTFTEISRYCNYREGGGYAHPCSTGTVGLSSYIGEKYTENGEIKTATSYSLCAPCEQVDTATLNSRARCESCGGTWESSQPGTQDEWMHGECKNRRL